MLGVRKFLLGRRIECFLKPVLPAVTTIYCARMMSAEPSFKYEAAIEKLMSLPSVTSVLKTAEKESQTGNYSVRNSNVAVTRTYLNRLGITTEDMDKLRVIHVAGTKGKGSTCALTESILRHCGYSTGFTSSPHLMEARERIRLNGKVIPRDLFCHYFNEIWSRFQKCHIADPDNSPPRFPSFLKYIVVMSYYVFIKEKVDVAVVEVGLGGRYDCTNVIEHPTVTAITHLGYDHCSVLGYTIEEIASEKAGIIKPGVPVLTVNQHYSKSLPVLEEEAAHNNTAILQVPPLSHYPNPPVLDSETWSDNVSLSLQIAKKWLHLYNQGKLNGLQNGVTSTDPCKVAPFKIPEPFLRGITRCKWPGRNHVIAREHVTYHMDGAHTPVSIKLCAKWFKHSALSNRRKVLIVNTTRDRNLPDFVKIIRQDITPDLIIFCPNIASSNYIVKDCEWPEDIKQAMIKKAHQNRTEWDCSDIPALSFSSVEEAINHVEGSSVQQESDVLITGSLHLIGACLQVLQPNFLDEEIGKEDEDYSTISENWEENLFSNRC